MPTAPGDAILRHIHQLVETHVEQSDGQLLQRFSTQREEAAFAALLRRHGRLVWSVCRHVLHHEHDAEDAFQATFLVLARRATAIRKSESVASWLHGVAYRTALKAKMMMARRQRRERRAAKATRSGDRATTGASRSADLACHELQALLDEALQSLPEKYRAPFVLGCLEGRSRRETAAELGWKEGTVSSRIAEARRFLQARLTRRGVTLSAALTAGVLWGETASAALMEETVRLANGTASAPIAALASAVDRGPFVTRLRIAGLIAATVAVVSAFGYQLAAVGEPGQDKPKAAATKPVAARQSLHLDLHDDPLPVGAMVRLGTSRLRSGRHHLFLADGQRFVQSREDGTVQISAVPTGKPLALLRGTDIPGRKEVILSTAASSPDSKYLAAVCWEGRCGIWETATGRLLRWLESGRFYSIVQCDFSPDGKLLAVGAGAPKGGSDGITVGVYEVESGRQLFTTPGTNSMFAPDGKSVVTWNGYSGGAKQTSRSVAVPSGKVLSEFTHYWQLFDFYPPSDGVWFYTGRSGVQVWDVATGKPKYTLRGPEGGRQDPIYVRHAPGRRKLIAVGTKPAGVWCWDLSTGKELWQVRLAAKAYYPELSRDGKLLVLGDTAGTVRVLDAATGKERTSFRPATIGHVTPVTISPDGKAVATTSGGDFTMAAAFWDAATGKLLTDLPGHSAGITAAAFASDGGKVFTIGKDRTLRAWNSATGKELFRAATEPADFLAIASDGNTLFAGGPNAGTIRVLDARTGKSERDFPAFAKTLVGLALTRDGKRLIAAGRDEEKGDSFVRVLDARTGEKLREFGASREIIEQLAIRPDGEAVATSHAGQRVFLWDASGKKIVEQAGRGKRASVQERGRGDFVTPYRIGSVGLSLDGCWLAFSDQEQGVVIVNARSGREVGRVKFDVLYQSPSIRDDVRDVLAFSPDSQTIAWSGDESTADIFLIEVRSAQLRGRLPGDSSPVQHLVFSPDGSRLLSAGPDGSALIWDLTGRHRPNAAQVKPSTPAEIESCWTDLVGDDAVKAYRAIRTLTSAPAESAAFLGKHLQPIAAPDAQRLATLIGDLDSEAFATREAATTELTKLGALAEPALRKALDAGPSAEARRRIEQLLARLETAGATGEVLRTSRAIEILERIATPEARQLLQKLAASAPGAQQTREAKAALERLEHRDRR
jgi:RNA polymerase sigma factor (sigma-70 family)